MQVGVLFLSAGKSDSPGFYATARGVAIMRASL